VNAHSHTFPQTSLLSTAYAIIANGASVTISSSLSSDEEREFLDAAQWYIDTDGEDTDLADLIARADAWERYSDYAYEAHFRCDPMEFDDWFDPTASGSTVPMVSL